MASRPILARQQNVGRRQRENETYLQGIHGSKVQVDWGKLDDLMSQSDCLLLRILRGTSNASIPFEGLCQLLRRLGFDECIRRCHHTFTKEGIEEILRLRPTGRHATPYQVKQVRYVILKYRLGGQGD
jgi:hypothetical protein